MIGHLVIARGSVLNETADSVVSEYEPPHGQPVRLAVIEHARASEDRRVISIEVTCEPECKT